MSYRKLFLPKKRSLAVLVLFFSLLAVHAKTYYVTPNGKSSNSGTSFQSGYDFNTAFAKVSAGDTIYLQNGIYSFAYSAGNKNNIVFSKSGTASKPIYVVSETGGKAVFDFSFPAQEWVQDCFGFDVSGSYWYFKNIAVTRAGYHGVYVKGKYNTFENCAFYENRNTGLEINKGGSYTTVLNCDAYKNYDPKKNGSMADGFGPKQTMGPGNKFIGCRAWENSDDGYDCFDSPEIVTFESCWAFRNGVDVWQYGGFEGNGNGFKVGGNYAIANNRLEKCISFGHPAKGFDQNHNLGELTLLNCLAYDNGNNYGIGEAPASGGKHYFRNNISLGSVNLSNSDQAYNSWNSGFSASTGDFLSVNTSLATIARNADGSIPYTDLFRLKANSNLVDAGINVGLSFEGTAPDLGPFEIKQNVDCNGVENGSAILDNCGVCVGGTSTNLPCSGSLEAEDNCYVDGISLENTNANFSGEGYVNTDNAVGSMVRWVLKSEAEQTATLTFVYANGGGNPRNGELFINTVSVGTVELLSTGDWVTWQKVSVQVDLALGANEVELVALSDGGLANLDIIHLSEGVTDAACGIVTSSDFFTAEAATVLYPNPSTGQVFWDKESSWEVLNSQGEKVLQGQGKTLKLTAYPAGIYFIKLEEDVFKILKQ